MQLMNSNILTHRPLSATEMLQNTIYYTLRLLYYQQVNQVNWHLAGALV